MYLNSFPARKHLSGTLVADTAAAVAAGVLYKAVYFSVAGGLDIVDFYQNKVTITGGIGTVYPVSNYGAVTGGGTTLTAGQFVFLYD